VSCGELDKASWLDQRLSFSGLSPLSRSFLQARRAPRAGGIRLYPPRRLRPDEAGYQRIGSVHL
jgi:hypothetical protein